MTFFTSLTGLNAAQNELSALSNNIANVGTNGFKKTRVQFGDIVSRSAGQAANAVVGAGVALTGVKQMFGQGGFQTSSNALDMLIGGQGFFVVRSGAEAGGSIALSRNGAFSVDADRWVTDSEGRQLMVLPVTPDGSPTAVGASALQPLRLPETSGEPAATTLMQVQAVLPASATPSVAPFDRDDSSTYAGATSVTVHDATGKASTATLYYRRIDSAGGDPNKYWEVHGFVGDTAIEPVPGPGPQILTFDADGELTAPLGPTPFSGGFSINHADSVMRPEPFSIAFSGQDGYMPGRLEGVGVGLDGVVRASFSTGETRAIGKVALGNVANPEGLKQNGNASWLLAPASGQLMIGQPGEDGLGPIQAGALERSNVDLTEELVGLISAQRNFQANARAIDTASSLLQTIIQLRS